MAKKRYSPEQIIRKLREAEVLISKGQTAPGDALLPRPPTTFAPTFTLTLQNGLFIKKETFFL